MGQRKTMKKHSENTAFFLKGVKDGVPIALGYFAVSFSLGILARKAGLSPFQGFLASFLCNASAGEYAGFTLIGAGASYIEVALTTLIANARYFLMSCAESQRLAPDLKLRHRLLIGFDLTDEIFGISIAQEGCIHPFYPYGAMAVAIPGWSVGTMLGIIAGNLLPARAVNALGVTLYGMFLAIIIPPARKSKILAGLIAASFALSFLFTVLPFVSALPEGTRTIILTVGLSSLAAILFPRRPETEQGADTA
ncbi:MAG: AzlC family ABC transporter permease [Clostridia bacterium]|nr:AzlC family ABC transporter permease [Clostridia bacterium]